MAGVTLTEKILARASERPRVKPGDHVWVNADLLFTHDVCGPGTIGIFYQEFGRSARVWDSRRVVIIPDHYIFTSEPHCHRNLEILREFVREQGLPYFYDPATPRYRGVCHVGLPEAGHVRPGMVIFGTDSHTCTHGAFGAFATGIGNTDAAFILGTGRLLLKVPPTLRFRLHHAPPVHLTAKDVILRIIGDLGVDGATYAAMEFVGPGVEAMEVEERMTLCNMAVEAGAKNAIVAPDEKTFAYLRQRTSEPLEPLASDEDATWAATYEYDLARLDPVVAEPHSPANVVRVRDRGDVRIDRAYIGSCTGGKFTDFLMAARILKGRRVSTETCLVPATCEVAERLITETLDGKSLVEIFAEAGCEDIAPPSCAACLGGPPDTFGRARGCETILSTTNRNFIGRMGSKEARIYLASPLTVAASAVTGRITDPREFLA